MKSWHKHDLAPDYPLVCMTSLEQAEELRKVMTRFGKLKPMQVRESCCPA